MQREIGVKMKTLSHKLEENLRKGFARPIQRDILTILAELRITKIWKNRPDK